MITLTKNAVAIIMIVVGQRAEAIDGGLRITAPGERLRVSFVPRGEAGDIVHEQGGARVFLDAAAASRLEGKTLDGRVDDAGSPSFDVVEPTG